jgi:flagellum-specific peptidoglycan hydrolase FlgJ
MLVLLVGLPLLFNQGAKSSSQTVAADWTPKTFIKAISADAKELGAAYGIKPSFLIAQASVETDFGRNLLGKYNNLYGLKSLDGRDNVRLKEKVEIDGKETWQIVYYQTYPSWTDSMRDYLERIRQGEFGETFYENLVQAESSTVASTELILSHFKQDSAFADQMVEVIKEYKLEQYDE